MRRCTTLCLIIVVLLLSGCETRRANMRPERGPDLLVEPPPGQYESPSYPREAFDPSNFPPKPPTAVNRELMPTSGFGNGGNLSSGPHKF
jgi:hypothetical protein